jgi:exodeoxyribonuclease-3
MRIISYNVNGIRAAIKKGFLDWLATNPADVVCIQETKANPDDIDKSAIEKLGFESYWFSAEKRGYSGVAIFSKKKPDAIKTGTGHAMSDYEGRVIQADFGNLSIINAYFPSGTSGDVRQGYKYIWLDEFLAYVNDIKKSGRKLIIVGDYNIAHKEMDIHDPKGNKKSSGFLPEERAWMDKWLEAGFVDTFRYLHPEVTGAYSWWSQRFPGVRLQNKGWRIDYICATENLWETLKAAAIYPDVKHSDHCPIYADFEM